MQIECQVKSLFYCISPDVSGGHSPSILDAMRAAMASSRALSFTHPDQTYSSITYHEAFYLGTLGGAKGMFFACICMYKWFNKGFNKIIIIYNDILYNHSLKYLVVNVPHTCSSRVCQ